MILPSKLACEFHHLTCTKGGVEVGEAVSPVRQVMTAFCVLTRRRFHCSPGPCTLECETPLCSPKEAQ